MPNTLYIISSYFEELGREDGSSGLLFLVLALVLVLVFEVVLEGSGHQLAVLGDSLLLQRPPLPHVLPLQGVEHLLVLHRQLVVTLNQVLVLVRHLTVSVLVHHLVCFDPLVDLLLRVLLEDHLLSVFIHQLPHSRCTLQSIRGQLWPNRHSFLVSPLTHPEGAFAAFVAFRFQNPLEEPICCFPLSLKIVIGKDLV